jgi:hypothetical protein
MGFLDRVKTVRAMYQQAVDTVEQWAQIIAVGPRLGPFTVLQLEIHYGGRPPVEASTIVIVPRDVLPEVGQHVAYRTSIGHDVTHYEVEWGQPPNYGSPGEREANRQRFQQLRGQPSSALEAGAAREDRLKLAQGFLDRGLITQADFDRAQAALRSDPDSA